MKIRYITRVSITATVIALMLSLALASMAAAAGTINLTPNTQAAGGSVTVDGTGFGATKPVGIGFGSEVSVADEAHVIANVDIGPDGDGVYGPFTATTLHYPIKPGSLSFHCVVSSDSSVVESDYTDNGDGTLASSSQYAVSPFVNYVTGEFGRSSNSAWSTYTVTYTVAYTYYVYNATPDAGVTTSGAGAFNANINVPAVADGTYTVTAVDTAGNMATSNLTVSSDTVPDVWSFGGMLIASTAAVVLGASYMRKRKNLLKHD
jgi:hypothetical protein